MTPILNANVSLFEGSFDTTVQETVSLATVLHRIQNGTYRRFVERLQRTLHTKGETAYKKAKEKSVAFTPCCALTTRDQDVPWPEKLRSCTGLVHLDCDDLEDPERLKSQLAQDKCVVFAFVSPRGNGLKVGIAATDIVDTETYKHAWSVVVGHIQTRYPDVHINVDQHVKFLHALCYMSYDPAPYVNADATPLVIPPPAPQEPRPAPLPDDRTDYALVMQALYCIPNHDAAYDDWLTLGMALHSTEEPWARPAWDQWSTQSGKYDAGKQDKSWRSFKADGKTTIGTLFHMAKEHGWMPPRKRQETPGPRHIPDLTQAASTDAPQRQNGKACQAHAIFIEGDSIEDEDIVYLWPPYIPRKMPSILDGDPGAGKTMLACQIAAKVSRGHSLPDQQGQLTLSTGEPGNVLMVAMEDHLAAVVKKRLVACGADLSKITFVNDIVDEQGTPRPFTLADIPLLTEYMERQRPHFVYIDAIQAVLGTTVDINRANQVTAILRPLKTLAEHYDCAIVCSRHPAKPGQNVAKLIHRGMASQAFVGTARSALFVEEHPTEKTKALLVHYKSNTGELGRTQIYSKAGKVEWRGITRITKDTLSGCSGKGASPQAVLEACIWLEERLEGNLTWNAKDIETEAEEQDISKNVLQRAKKNLGVISAQLKGDAHAGWTWRLPPLPVRHLSTSSSEDTEDTEGTEGTEVPDLKTNTYGGTVGATLSSKDALPSDPSDPSVPSDPSDTQVPKIDLPAFCPGCGRQVTWLNRATTYKCHHCPTEIPKHERS
jgi:AAA domain/Primase C terminal 2 (PriCT-2)/VirE N-terminal domain